MLYNDHIKGYFVTIIKMHTYCIPSRNRDDEMNNKAIRDKQQQCQVVGFILIPSTQTIVKTARSVRLAT